MRYKRFDRPCVLLLNLLAGSRGVPLNMLFAIMVGSYHNRKFAIMVFAIMVGSYHNRKFAIMVFAIMVWNLKYIVLIVIQILVFLYPVIRIIYLRNSLFADQIIHCPIERAVLFFHIVERQYYAYIKYEVYSQMRQARGRVSM